MRVLLVAAFATQAITFVPAFANAGPPDTPASVAMTDDLEKAFWVCDYAGTHGSVAPDYAASCIAITEELKRVKFDGDFDRLVAWWKQHKPVQHAKVKSAGAGSIEHAAVKG